MRTHLTLSRENLSFPQDEILLVAHLCEPYSQKPSLVKIDLFRAMEEVCESQSKVRRFLGVVRSIMFGFHTIWTHHGPSLPIPTKGEEVSMETRSHRDRERVEGSVAWSEIAK